MPTHGLVTAAATLDRDDASKLHIEPAVFGFVTRNDTGDALGNSSEDGRSKPPTATPMDILG